MIMDKHIYILIVFIIHAMTHQALGLPSKQESDILRDETRRLLFKRDQACPNKNMCKSKWGFCGYGAEYCGKDCQSGPCTGNTARKNSKPKSHGHSKVKGDNAKDIIHDENFRCAFKSLVDKTRRQRLDGLKRSGWKPKNADEAAVFLAHVYHETDGLKTLTEHCAPGCGPKYAKSWCNIKGVSGKLYYGRGWFQLSYPCNYNAAGKALGLDLLHNPDLVSQRQDVAVKTAVWFYQTNEMADPAQQGDFAATTRIINGKQECDRGPGANNQRTRVETYKRIRKCFGLGEPKKNPTC